MTSLERLGWTASREAELEPCRGAGLVPARVTEEQRDGYRVLAADGELRAVLPGRLRHRASDRHELPAVGDWVVVDPRPCDGTAVVVRVLPRSSALVRRSLDVRTSAQVVAANLDTVFLMSSVNRDFNPRRLERYLALIGESGAEVVLLLSKCDLRPDPEVHRMVAEAVATGATVHAVSSLTGMGLPGLARWLAPGATIGLVGSSGVGKSTLVNRLAREEVMAVREIRGSDDRGRHTTSHRQLVLLPCGAMVVDTPGMREIALWDADEGLTRSFADIEELARSCRFRDCTHTLEPGCRVLGAVGEGILDEGRLASWRKLGRELAHVKRRRDIRERLEETRKWKRITREMRERQSRVRGDR